MRDLTPKPKRRRKWLNALLLLIAGATMNVALAWILVTLNDSMEEPAYLEWLEGDGAAEAGWPFDAPADWPPPTDRTVWRAFGTRGAAASVSHEVEPPAMTGAIIVLSIKYLYQYGREDWGWPMLALRSEEILTPSSTRDFAAEDEWTFDFHRGVMPPSSLPLVDFESHWYPLRPIWPGFAINTLLYAAAAWLLLFTTGTTRSYLRARRGLCINCKYPITGHTLCPECGAPAGTPAVPAARE